MLWLRIDKEQVLTVVRVRVVLCASLQARVCVTDNAQVVDRCCTAVGVVGTLSQPTAFSKFTVNHLWCLESTPARSYACESAREASKQLEKTQNLLNCAKCSQRTVKN